MNTSSQDFSRIRNQLGFVDKSLLIAKVLNNKNSVILITAPRRFGKSVNLNMLRRFFEKTNNEETMETNRRLFDGLLIADEKYSEIVRNHCGKYPILYLDFKNCAVVRNFDEALSAIRRTVHKAYLEHEYLYDKRKFEDADLKFIQYWCANTIYGSKAPDPDSIIDGLTNLARYLCTYHAVKKIILLVDEYDCVCSKAILNVEESSEVKNIDKEIKSIIDLCASAIGCLAKGKEDVVERVVLTGISSLITQGLSGLNNVNRNKFQESETYSEFYGLTNKEVVALLNRYNLGSKQTEVELHYNGYKNNMFSVYSFMCYLNSAELIEKNDGTKCLVNPKLENYWKASGSMVIFEEVVRNNIDIRSLVMRSMVGEIRIRLFKKLEYQDVQDLRRSIKDELFYLNDPDLFFNFLLEQGYLKIIRSETIKWKKFANVKVPNKEIETEFRYKLHRFFKTYSLSQPLVDSCALLFEKLNSDCGNNQLQLKKIQVLLEKIFQSGRLTIKNEATYHNILFGIIFFNSSVLRCLSEVITPPDKNQCNRLDIAVVNPGERLGIIIELKHKGKPSQALKRIKTEGYSKVFFKEEVKPILEHGPIVHQLHIGLNISAKTEITMAVKFVGESKPPQTFCIPLL